ncbi:hypothetical protein Z517_12460 [Fonsecaea pedrosoi CBS 271.37]|uniref:Uncharacterized protein n=1 Tax=Fonsecaea pedrosoi CBS 271.37 TaxID=1442368 RepID=A0A0D2G757_9EURO|nr:uncharacterized protein Z517_12460 [Fonsecaea pedrosoi CBS 271.37]KIW74520.1 hypothetical protein Z517_12460 [Fonsecaea pedrosoi CBS 271.37]
MDLHAPHTAAALADTPHRRHHAHDRLFTATTAGERNPIITLPDGEIREEDGEIREEDGESGGPTDTTTPDAPIKLFSEGSETTVVDGSIYSDKDSAAEDDTDADEAKKISDSPGTPYSELVDRGRPLVALPEDLDTDTASGGARNEG